MSLFFAKLIELSRKEWIHPESPALQASNLFPDSLSEWSLGPCSRSLQALNNSAQVQQLLGRLKVG